MIIDTNTNTLVQIYLESKKIQGIALKDYVLQNDGDGVYILYWNESKLGVQPTKQDLQSCTLALEKQQCLSTLKSIYSSTNTWLIKFISGDFVKNDWDLSSTQNQDNTIINSKITDPILLTFWNSARQSKVVKIDPNKMPEILLQTVEISQKLGKLNFSIFTEINSATTSKTLSKYTQEYIQAEFDKINKTIIID